MEGAWLATPRVTVTKVGHELYAPKDEKSGERADGACGRGFQTDQATSVPGRVTFREGNRPSRGECLSGFYYR